MSTAHPSPQSTTTPSGARLQGWELASVLIALMLSLLLAALDQTIVGTALPRIAGELDGYSLLPWVGTAYLLTSATAIPIIGKLSDQFGRKWFLIGGVIVFLTGSALCGASQTINQLIAFRAFQGLGGAALLGLVFTLVGDIFPPAERPRWQGLFGVVFGVSSVLGPLIGGYLTDNVNWRWIFYVNLPIGAVALVALYIWLPTNISIRTTQQNGWEAVRRIDWLGAAFSAAATVCLLIGLTWISLGKGRNGYDWDSPQVIGIILASVVLFVAFYFNERQAQNPILPLKLFQNDVFTVSVVLSLLLGMAFFSVVYYLPTFGQGVLGLAATNSGVIVIPLSITQVATSVIGGRVVAQRGRYKWLVVTGGVFLLAGVFLLSRENADSGVWAIVRDMLVMGVGLGALLPTLTLAIQNAVPRTQLGVATASATYVRSLGATLGIAVFGSVINSTFKDEINKNFPTSAFPQGAPPQAIDALKSQDLLSTALTNPTTHDNLGAVVNPTTHQTLHDQIVQAVSVGVPPGPTHDQIVAQISTQITDALALVLHAGREALGDAIVRGFGWTAVVCLISLILTIFLRDIPLSKGQQPATGNVSPHAVGETLAPSPAPME